MFVVEGRYSNLETLDLCNNQITAINPNIYKWQKMYTLNLENNDIRQFPPEMGYMSLKNLSISGNPTMLIKNKSLFNTTALLEYLRDRVGPNAKKIDLETNEIRNLMINKTKRKRPEKILEYEYQDPFKARSNNHNQNLRD